jgi:hypothetical protein
MLDFEICGRFACGQPNVGLHSLVSQFLGGLAGVLRFRWRVPAVFQRSIERPLYAGCESPRILLGS